MDSQLRDQIPSFAAKPAASGGGVGLSGGLSALTAGGGRSAFEVAIIVLVAVVIIGGCEILLTAFNVPQYILPKPSLIGAALVSEWPLLWPHLVTTLCELLIGFSIAWLAYIKDTSIPAKTVKQLGPLYRFLYNKWYFDEPYNVVFVKPAFWLGRIFWQKGDVGIIDRFGPNGAAWVVEKGAVVAKKVQSGYLYSYALVMLLGLVAAISWVMVR